MKRINKLAMHPSFPIVASGSDDGSVRLWDYETMQLYETFREHAGAVSHISFNSDGNYLASSSSDTTIKLWNIPKGHCFRTIQAHDHQVSSVEFLPYGGHIVSCSRD